MAANDRPTNIPFINRLRHNPGAFDLSSALKGLCQYYQCSLDDLDHFIDLKVQNRQSPKPFNLHSFHLPFEGKGVLSLYADWPGINTKILWDLIKKQQGILKNFGKKDFNTLRHLLCPVDFPEDLFNQTEQNILLPFFIGQTRPLYTFKKMLMTFFDVQCVIKEFKSDQLSVNQYDQSTLGDNFSHLGQDTLLGNGQQNCDFCLDVELGSLSTGQAPLFFKGNTKYAQLMFLTKAFLGPLYKVSYGINVIRNETDNIGMRLGFNTVLTPQKTSITYTVRL